MLWIRSLLFNVSFILWTTVCAVLGLPAVFGNRRYVHDTARRWGKGTNFLLKHLVHIEVEFRGLEHLKGGPHLLAAKHQSVWETAMVETLVPDCAIILKRELMWIPLFGQLLWASGMISIDRKKGTKIVNQILAGARACFEQGRSVWIFPEGTRRAPGAEPDYKYGIYALYHGLNVPVIPVALNSGSFWPRRQFLKKPGKIIVEVLPPLEPGLKARAFLKALETAIESKSNELIPKTKNSLERKHA